MPLTAENIRPLLPANPPEPDYREEAIDRLLEIREAVSHLIVVLMVHDPDSELFQDLADYETGTPVDMLDSMERVIQEKLGELR